MLQNSFTLCWCAERSDCQLIQLVRLQTALLYCAYHLQAPAGKSLPESVLKLLNTSRSAVLLYKGNANDPDAKPRF
jgi:hypothetical protein